MSPDPPEPAPFGDDAPSGDTTPDRRDDPGDSAAPGSGPPASGAPEGGEDWPDSDVHGAQAQIDIGRLEERPSMSYWAIVLAQFRKNRIAVVSLVLLLLMYLVAVYAPLFAARAPFIYIDRTHQALSLGDQVALGDLEFSIVAGPAPPLADADGVKNNAPAGQEAPAERQDITYYYLEGPPLGEPMLIRDGLRVGSAESCAIRHDGLAPEHAAFGLFGGKPVVRDIPASQCDGETPAAPTVKVNGELLGQTEYPFFWSLFDENEYEMSVDRFFNFMIFGLPMVVLLYLWWRKLATVQFGLKTRGIRAAGALMTAAVMIGGFAWVYLMPESRPYRNYQQDLLEEGADLATMSPFISGPHSWGIFPPIRRSYRDQNPKIRLKAPWKRITNGDFLLPFGAKAKTPCAEEQKRSLFSLGYLFGTDDEGRDVSTRLLFGTRISLTIGIFAVSIYVAIGIFLGGLAGYFGGWVDMLIMRFIEIMMCFPSFFLILTLIAVLESRSIFYIMVIIGVTRWTGVARLIRGEFLKQKSIDYVTAAKALGVSRMKIMFKHILPNAMAPVLVAATFGIAAAILTEASLSFLGLGDVRAPSWGQILTAGRSSGEDYLIIVPGLAIFFTVTILNLVGEGTRDALDPKLRQ